MQTDPVEEWRRLTALYAEMGDVEIREFADQINDLTPVAQQILRDELKKRSMPELRSGSEAPFPVRQATLNQEPARYRDQQSEMPDTDDGAVEYTWKTELCTCNTAAEAWQMGETLKRSGIDSWIEPPQGRLSLDGPRVMVAADQLEAARQIAAQPIPQDIIEESTEVADAGFENPVCPKCGEGDPTLESVEPTNNWLCESCGHTWSDPVPDPSKAIP